MPSYDRKTMCQQCPFRKQSVRGWLGPWTITDILTMIRQDENFICHMDIESPTRRNQTRNEVAEKGQHCVGMLRYMNSILKLSRDPVKAEAQKDLKTIEDREVIPAGEFRVHHTIPKNDE